MQCSAALHICPYINETHWPTLLSGPLSSLGSSERACDDCSVLHRVQLPFNHPPFSNFSRRSLGPISLANLPLLHQYFVKFSHRGITLWYILLTMMHCTGHQCKYHGTETVVSGGVVLNGPLNAPFCMLTVHKYCMRISSKLSLSIPADKVSSKCSCFCPILFFFFFFYIMRENSVKCNCKSVALQ